DRRDLRGGRVLAGDDCGGIARGKAQEGEHERRGHRHHGGGRGQATGGGGDHEEARRCWRRRTGRQSPLGSPPPLWGGGGGGGFGSLRLGRRRPLQRRRSLVEQQITRRNCASKNPHP